MSRGVDRKRRRAVSDWVVQPLEGRVLLSGLSGLQGLLNQAGLGSPTPTSTSHASHTGPAATTIFFESSTQPAVRHPSVTLTATVTAPSLSRPVGVGLVRFIVVSPTHEVLGSVAPNARGDATLTTRKLTVGETYLIQAEYVSPSKQFASSSEQLDVAVTPSQVTSFLITAPQYFGAPGTPITFSVTAVNRAGRPVTDYTGTIQFVSPTDHSAKFSTRTYTFTPADQGTHEFPDGVTFHKGGAEVVKVSQTNNTSISESQPFGIE